MNEEKLKIDQNISIPCPKNGGRNKKMDNIRKTILLMQVGDSVFFTDKHEAMRFRTRAETMSKRQEATGKWVIRKLDSEPTSWRIWRVK